MNHNRYVKRLYIPNEYFAEIKKNLPKFNFWVDSVDLFDTTINRSFYLSDGCKIYFYIFKLEYNDYRNFLNAIAKAKEACLNSRHEIVDHFVDVTDMIEIGKGGQRQTTDIRVFMVTWMRKAFINVKD